MQNPKAKPLSAVPTGQTVTVVKVNAGRGLNSRLASMGILPNTRIAIIRSAHPGPFVVSVNNTKMVLGRGVAEKIIVL